MISPRTQLFWEWRRRAQMAGSRISRLLLVITCTILFPASLASAQLDDQVFTATGSGEEAPGDVSIVADGSVPDVEDSQLTLDESELGSGPDESLDAKLERPGSIALRNASLGDWLFAIREEWGVNIVYSANDVKDAIVNGEFAATPLREVLDAILLVRGYGYQRIGSSLMILPEGKMGPMKPHFIDKMIRLEFNDPKDLAESVAILLSDGGLVRPLPNSNSIYVADLPDRIAKVEEHVLQVEAIAREVFDRNRLQQEALAAETQQAGVDSMVGPEASLDMDQEAVNVYRLRFVKADSLLETVQSILGAEGRMTVLIDENKLVVIAPNSTLQGVTELIRRLDVPRPQVRITALLYDVNTEDVERLGFNWSNVNEGRFDAAGDPQSLASLSSSNFSDNRTTGLDAVAVVADPVGGLLRLQHLSRYFNMNTVFQAFSELEGARLLARPTVVAYDGVQASFRSVSEIPVQQLTQTEAGGSIGTTEFREAGITLTVTPTVNDDGSLRLQIAPEFSVLAGFQNGQPIIDRRSASTTVYLMDGQAVVIGGLLRRNELESQRGVPGLRRLKFFGPLFKDHDTTVAESELLVFVQAEIISPNSVMVPRNQMAEAVLTESMERIPVASPHPVIPHCGDPYCPYHSPAPRWIGPGMVVHGEPIYTDEAVGEPAPDHLPSPGTYEPQGVPNAASEASARPKPPYRSLPVAGPGSRRDLRLPGFQIAPPRSSPTGDAQARQQVPNSYPIRRLPHISTETDRSRLVPASATSAPIGGRNNNAHLLPTQRTTRPVPAENGTTPRTRPTNRRQVEQRLRASAPPQASNAAGGTRSWLKRFIRYE